MSFLVDKCPHCGVLVSQRTEIQNTQFHVLCSRLSRLQEWPQDSGKKHSVIFWKRLIICSWERAHDREAMAVPALDGSGMDLIYTRTSKMATEEKAGLIEYAQNWMAVHGGTH